MAYRVGGLESQEEFDKKLREMFPERSSYTVGEDTRNFTARLVKMKNGATRIAISDADNPDTDSLYIDARPGPKLGNNQSAVILDYSDKGSKHKRAVTNEVYFNSEKPIIARGDVTIRSAQEALRDTAYGSFFVGRHRASGQQGRFHWLATHGSEEQRLSGGWQNISPLITSSALQSLARNVTVGFGKSIKNPDNIIEKVNTWINAKGKQPTPAYADFFSRMAGMIPSKEVDGKIRFRPVNESIPEANSVGEYMFYHLGKLSKGINATRGEREQLSESGMFTINKETGLLTPLAPKIIRDMKSEGTSRLNIQIGEGVAPSALVSRNVLSTAGLPDSGARVVYNKSSAENQNEIGPYYQTQKPKMLHPSTMGELERTSFEWGIFGKDKNGNWVKKSDMVGYSLEPNQRAVIGLQTKTDLSGNQTISPIRITNTDRISVLTGLPTLNLPPAINDVTDEFAPIPGRVQSSTGAVEAREITEDEMQKLVSNMGGGEVSANTIGKVSLSIPIAIANAVGEKQYGAKSSIEYEYGVIGQGERGRTVHVGEREVELQSITASIKNPLLNFIYGQVGTMPTPKIRQLISETYGSDSPLLEEIDKTIAYQNDLMNNTALSESERSQQWRGIDIEKLALIQAEKTGNQLYASSPMSFVKDLRDRALKAQRANPERYWDEYQMGQVTTPEFVDYKTIHKDEIDFQRRRLQDAIDATRAEIPDLYADEQWQGLSNLDSPHSLFKFEQIEGKEDLFKWSIKSFGVLGTQASSLVTEHADRGAPRLSLEQTIAVATRFPKIAGQIFKRAARLETPGNRAWGHMVTYFNSLVSGKVDAEGKPLMYGENNYSTLTDAQALTIGTKLSGLEGNSLQLMQSVVDEVIGNKSAPLLRLESSGKQFPAPKTAHGISQSDVIDESLVENIDRFSKLYQPALSDFLADKTDSAPMQQFENTLIAALVSSGGGVQKSLQSVPVIGTGGKGAASAGLPPNVVSVPSYRMKQYIKQSLEAQGIISGAPKNRQQLREQIRLLNQAYSQARKQGGLPAFYTKSPNYTADSVNPVLLRDARMMRDAGLNVPDDTYVKNGKIIKGGMGLWGMVAGVGVQAEKVIGDFDLDRAVVVVAENWKRTGRGRKSNITGTIMNDKEYANLLTQSGPKVTQEVDNILLGLTGGNKISNMSAVQKEMASLIEVLATEESRRGFIDEDKFSLVNQQKAGNIGLTAINVKSEMGKSYNVRRLINSVMETNPDISQEDQLHQYSAFGLSYAKHLEMPENIPVRGYEQFLQTFTPSYSENKQGWDFQYMDSATGQFRHTEKLDFNQLEGAFRQTVYQDVGKGLLNPDSALMFFSRNSEEYNAMLSKFNENPENRSSEENMQLAVQKIISEHGESTEGYDFSQTIAGETFQTTLEDKLKGVTGKRYRLPPGSEIGAGKQAIGFMAKAQITYDNKTTSVEEFLEKQSLNVATTLLKAEKRKTGIPLPEEVIGLSQYAQTLTDAGKQPKATLQHAIRSFNADTLKEATAAEGVHNVQTIDVKAFQSYRPTPNELNKILDTEPKTKEQEVWRNQVFQNIYAKTQLGISNPGAYIEQNEKFTKLGREFERVKGQEILDEQGYTATFRPPHRMTLGETGSVFNWSGGNYQIDAMGINPKTGRFFVADYKWLATEEGAKEMLANPKKSLPQLTAYADTLYRMAHPEKYLENWDEVKETLTGNAGETYFTESIITALQGKKKEKLSEDDLNNVREFAPQWYHAIRKYGVERTTLAGIGGKDSSDVPMQFYGAMEWGAINDETEAVAYNQAAMNIMQNQYEKDITRYASQYYDSVKLAEDTGTAREILSGPTKAKLAATASPLTRRQIPATEADLTGAVNRTFTGKKQYSKVKDGGSSGSGFMGGGGGGGESSRWGPWATEKTVREMADYFEERFGPADDVAHPFSRKTFDKNILRQKFYTGVGAAENLLSGREQFENLPRDMAKQISEGLSQAGAVPSIVYDESTNQLLSNGVPVAGEEANVLIAKDFSRLEKANPDAYRELVQANYGLVKRTTKDIQALVKGEDATNQLGITQKTPKQFAESQQIAQAKQIPNLGLASSLMGDAVKNPQNKPAGFVDTDESTAALMGRYLAHTGENTLGKFEKELQNLSKTFSDITKSHEDLVKSNRSVIEVNGKQVEITKDLNAAQKEYIAAAKEEMSGPEDRVAKARRAIQEADRAMELYSTGEISADTARPYIQKGVTAMSTVNSATRALSRAGAKVESVLEGDYPEAPETFGEGFRHAFGGFGLFYLRTLFSYGFGSYQKGYEATVQQKTLANQLATARYGAADVEPYESEELQKQRNLLIAGGSTWENLQGLGNAINKSSDISGGLLSGLGAYAATQHLAKPLAAIGRAFGATGLTEKMVTGAAGLVGGYAAVGMLGYSMYSNAVNYEDSIMRAAAQDDPYYEKENWLSKFTLAGPKILDWYRYTFTDYKGEGTGAFTGKKENYQWETMLANEGMATRQHYMLMPSEEQQRILNSLAINGVAPLTGLTPEQSLSLLNRYTTGDINSSSAVNDYGFLEKVGNIGRAELAGRNVGLLSQQVSVATGMGYKEHGDLIDIANYYAELSGAEFTKSTIGMDLINRLPSISRNLNEYVDEATGLPKLGELQKKFDMLAEIGSGPLADAYMQRIEVAKNAAAVGRTIDVNPENFALTFNPSAQSGQIFAQNALYSRQNQLSSILQQAGMNGRRANNFVDNFASAQELNFAERLMSFSPTAIGDLAKGLSQAGENQGAAYFDKFALTDYNLQGQQTGLGHWTTSLRGATSSALQNANMIWGKGNWEGSKIAQAAVYGINRDTGEIYKPGEAIPEGANVVGGRRGIQWQQYYQGIEYQQKQFGIQQRQLALQEQYQPMFWAQEDKQREFSYRQQEWSFNQQEASMEMQSRHFQQNMAFQQKQAYMQRGWTAEDWGYQDLTRSLQWGWKQEDFAEQSRFMTGRDRKIAERGMERETTLFNLESGQIDKTRDRQKQMWALEDERFAIQKEQYAEQKKFQEDALAKQREFFEEQKQLTEESVTLNRQYQTEQIALQKESLAIQMEYAVTQNETNKLLMEMSDKEEDMQAAFALAKEKQLEFFNMAVEGFEFLGIEFKQMIQSIISGTPYEAGSFASGGDSGSGGGGGGGNVEMPMAKGGDMFPGMAYIVGEAGMERVRPNTLGSVVNQYDIAQTLRQTDRWTNRSVFYPSNQGGTSGSPQTINVYVGNDKLASFVLNTVKKDLEVF